MPSGNTPNDQLISTTVNDTRAISLAWTLPIMLLVYLGLGGWIGKMAGAPVTGFITGWLLGMFAIFYEMRKEQQRQERRAKTPAADVPK